MSDFFAQACQAAVCIELRIRKKEKKQDNRFFTKPEDVL